MTTASPPKGKNERNCALSISNLTFGFSDNSAPVLQNLSIQIAHGEIVSILGRSGCGKSTLLNLIAGLIKSQKGDLVVDGTGGAKASGRIGYIFQEDALLPWRTVAQNLGLATQIGNVSKAQYEADLRDFLSTFHLDQTILEKYPAQLSGGMKQRVSIIQTLLFNPKLLLLDEPFSALDFYTKLCLEAEFYNLVKTKAKTAVLVTHDIEEAIAVSDRVILMSGGGVIHAEIPIRFQCERNPESIRGSAEFAEYYRIIWSEFKSLVKL